MASKRTNTRVVAELTEMCAEQIEELESMEGFCAEKAREFTQRRMEIHVHIAMLKLKVSGHQTQIEAE